MKFYIHFSKFIHISHLADIKTIVDLTSMCCEAFQELISIVAMIWKVSSLCMMLLMHSLRRNPEGLRFCLCWAHRITSSCSIMGLENSHQRFHAQIGWNGKELHFIGFLWFSFLMTLYLIIQFHSLTFFYQTRFKLAYVSKSLQHCCLNIRIKTHMIGVIF